ncbi:MAG TPA: amidohydrolase family protein [Patescibacteria group bacterium]|nr:amidohydrolase family protein [Patescibacteria group bacterium]
MKDFEGSAGSKITRRRILQGCVTAAAVGAVSTMEPALAYHAVTDGVRPVDIHAHFFSQSYLDVIAKEGKPFGVEYRNTAQGLVIDFPFGTVGPAASKIVDLKERIAAMDEQGVAVHAMSLTYPMAYWGSAEVSSALCGAWNDAASAAHKAYPDRLVFFTTLPMLYPDRALDELNRTSKLPGMRGVYLGTNIGGHDLDDHLFEPVFARIEELGLPIFLHPIQTVGGERMKPYYLVNLLGNPFDTAIAACHLIFGGVLDRHPKLQFCLAHAGGALPIVMGRVDYGWKVRPELQSLHLPQPPSAYLQRFTFDTIAHSKAIMQFVIQEAGVGHIMLGSDYCFDMGYSQPVRFVNELELSKAERKMILGGTAARILKL